MYVCEVSPRTLALPMRASMSWFVARARPQIVGPLICCAISFTDSKSPGEEIGNPASITSTLRRASCFATSSFFLYIHACAGDCSPSRSVVSKITIRRSINNVPFWALIIFRCLHAIWKRVRIGAPRLAGSPTLTPSQWERVTSDSLV